MEELLYSANDILERVDEYTLYCYYLGYGPIIGARYESPVRKFIVESGMDADPSFGLFVPTRVYKNIGGGVYPNEFLWRDMGLGIGGDIFELVRRLYKLVSRRDAFVQVMLDTGMLPGERTIPVIDVKESKFVGYSNISIVSRAMTHMELKYWKAGNITPPLLDRYFTTSVRAYWLYDDQQYPRFAPKIAFAYRIWDKYQLYFPHEPKRWKFRTNWTYTCVPGYLQLEYNQPLLIITKSMKDVMVLRSFGYEAISPRGENIMLPVECIEAMKRKYQRILVLFDNDMKHKGDEYEFEKVYVPLLLPGDKDVYGFCINHGPSETVQMLNQIFHE